MNRIKGFKLRSGARSMAKALPAPVYDEATRDRVMAKIRAMGEAFYAMSEAEYGDWLDALPQDEFIEFISLMIELDERNKAERKLAA